MQNKKQTNILINIKNKKKHLYFVSGAALPVYATSVYAAVVRDACGTRVSGVRRCIPQHTPNPHFTRVAYTETTPNRHPNHTYSTPNTHANQTRITH